jgi:hypothetical protein
MTGNWRPKGNQKPKGGVVSEFVILKLLSKVTGVSN